LPTSVGAQIRREREARGMSLRKLAAAVGVSPSLISQIERGKASPSVATLYATVTVLQISLDALFAEDGSPPSKDVAGNGSAPTRQAVSSGPVVRRSERASLVLGTGVRWERLTATHDPLVDFLFVEYTVGGASSPADALMTHSGREYGLVLEGRLGATVGFESYELEPGDSIAFESATPHRFWTIGDSPAVVVWTVVGRSGDPRYGPQSPSAGSPFAPAPGSA
jgi:transcriptional regulator with XRE-family HTH domain